MTYAKVSLMLNEQALAERMNRERRHDRIVRHLDSYKEEPAKSLARIDSDFLWWDLWKSALGFWAKCPSNDVRAWVRETIRSRLPAPHLLPEMAVYEPDLDTAEDSYDR